MIENLRATNKQGLSITFDESLRMTSGLDLSGLTAQVNATETTGAGARYQNTRLNVRNLDLEFQIRRQFSSEALMDDKRALMYKVFTPESSEVRFDFNLTDGTAYYFTAHTTAAPIMPPSKATNNDAYQLALVQMVCTDPYIYKSIMNRAEVSIVNSEFMFPLEIPSNVGIEMGTYTESLSINIYNEGTGDIGMVIKFKAISAVSNPEIINVLTYEKLGLNIDMLAGDEITIDTTKGKRGVTLNRNNVVTNVFNTFDFATSSFFQLHPGENILRYNASSGLSDLAVEIEYNSRFVGV